MPTNPPKVLERDGRKGGEYFYVDLSEGRRISVSRKRDDKRVWLGEVGVPSSYADQAGGVGSIDHLLGKWFAQVAIDDRSRSSTGR